MGKVGNLKRLVVALGATAAVLIAAAVSGAAPAPVDVKVYDQCANGDPPSTSTSCPGGWINGILQASNSHYAEDEVTPQRLVLELEKNSATTGRTVEISYLTRKGGVHAYDSLATWNYTQSSADHCQDLPGSVPCPSGSPTTFPIPLDGTVVADSNAPPYTPTSSHQLTGQVFTMYGGTITSVSSYTHDDAAGSSDSYAHVTITYSVPSTASGPQVMLLFGGHLAPSLGPRGWGVGVGSGSISGGPYHIRVTGADGGSVGSRDNQIMSSAILSPANILIKKVAVGGDGTFDYTATGGISSNFSITTSGGNGSQAFSSIVHGTYTVTESAPPPGWDFTNLVCVDEDGGSSVDLGQRKATIDLDPGETVTCTFTNTKRGKIIVEKQTNPDGATQLFSFTPSYASAFSLSDGQQNTSVFLAPGTYSVNETVPNGWSLTSATCDDGSSPSSIGLAAGETVKCTFTNSQHGQVIVKKVMVGGTDTFDYSGTPSGAISVNNGTISANVGPGQYVSTEAAKAGWDLSSISCSDGNSSGSVANRQATFNVEAGETVTCTFTNTKQGQVIVKKVMVGGTDTFDYTGTPAGTISSNNGTISASVSAGQYTSTEAAKAGWDLTNVVCDDANSSGSVANRQATFNVEAGETVTCTFTNRKQGQVIVKKVMVGGTDTFSYTGTPSGSISVNNGTISASVAPGAYSSVEDAKAGWSLTSVVCDDGNSSGSVGTRTASFNVEAGETVTCTFTNTKQGQVVVKKVMVGGTDSFDYTGTPAGTISVNNGTISANVGPGQYVSTEAAKAGWDLTAVSCDDGNSSGSVANRQATFNVEAGETVTCTFTNTKRGQVIVKKVMVGGTDTFNYTGTPSGSISANNGTISASVSAGQHVSTESAKAGWDLTSVVCDDANSSGSVANRQATFNVEAGEIVTCTFTNTKQGQVIVKKVMVGGTDSFDYTGTPAGTISSNNGTISQNVAPGQYLSTEAAKAGWDLTGVVCDDGNSSGSVANRQATFTVEAGEIVTCTFTNTKQGQVIVKKVMVGGTDSFDYTGTPVGTISSNNGTISQNVAPGQYLSTEAAKAGWDLTGVVCDDTNSSGSVANRQATFNVAAGEVVTCTFTNTKQGQIVVEKQTIPNGDEATFGFSGEIVATLGDGQSSSKPVAPGTYTVDEAAKAGWDLTSIVCDDSNSSGSLANRRATFNVAAGEVVKCTFTNTKQGQVIVKKVMVGGTDTFNYTGTPNGSIAVNNGTISQNVAPGQYFSTEAAKAGWDLTAVSCDDANSVGSIANRQATFNLEPGESVTCTFTNTKQGQVVVKKVMVGGTDSFDYSGTPSGSIAVNNGTVSANVAPGQYVSTEAVKAGWDLTSVACDDGNSVGSVANRQATFDVAAGEVVTCTFTNTKRGSIVVEKQTIPNGDEATFDFTGEIVATLGDGQSSSKSVEPGTYTVDEAAKAGWDLTSIVCDDSNSSGSLANRRATFNVAAGEVVKCTFTNTKLGTIIVEKQTNPNGDPQSFSFNASYDGDGFSLSDGQSNNSGALAPGTYSVSENVPAGWDLESVVCSDGSAPGSIGLAPGETVTCVFTNEKDAAIIVEKQTNPNGDPQSFSFNASYDGDGFSLSDGQSNNSGDLDPGTYSVSENVPQGWDLDSATCDDGSSPSAIGLSAGETVHCTFVNEKDSVIIVEKQTNPNGDPQLFHFDASYDEGGFSLADGQSNNSGDLDPGTYSVSEDVPEGWELESSTCSGEHNPGSIALAAGETVTCVFTNTKRGSIIVEKQTSPNGAAGSFSFSGDAAGSIGDNGQIVVSNLVPGTYTSTEAEAQSWSLSSISCNDANSTGSLGNRTATFRLEAGETVKCTFTNAKLGQGSIDVQKSVSPTSVKEPGGQVTYSVSIRNTSADVDVTITNVVDDKFGDLDDDGGNGCFDVPINMAPGEVRSCQFTKQITGVGGTSHVNVVTASGTDEAGNPVSDSDDAKVDITPRLIDLVIVKEASSPTPLNGIVNYSLTVTNKGPDTATNVQLADPAPVGITYLTANPSQGTCNVSPALITCSLGSIAAGQTVTIAITGRATTVGSHTNTATVTGGGGRETNPADNVDSAVTVVPAPLKPPTVKPPVVETEVCLSLTVSPKMIKADGKPDKVTVKVTAGKKPVKGIKVVVSGAGVKKSAKTNGKGVAVLKINPKKPGLITVTVVETNQKLCGPKRIGVVGVFLPPLTG